MLVTTTKRKKWGIPKGKPQPWLSLAENAAREAFEEAGILGEIAAHAVGSFRATKDRPKGKNLPRGKALIEVWVYFMRVDKVAKNWPERHKRRTKWMPCKEAARMVREPLLAELCRSLADGPPF